MKIYVTWPLHYAEWTRGNHMTNAQHSWHLFMGLRKRFEDVEWVPWDHIPERVEDGARLYSHTSWPVGRGGLAFPRIVKERGGQVYSITNDPLFDYVVEHGMYNLHGYKGFDHKGENYDPQLPCGYAQAQLLELMNTDVMFCHTSDVGLDLWHGRRPGGAKRRAFVKGHRFVPFMSPIDKVTLNRVIEGPWKKRFLITNGVSHRKQQQLFRHLCGGKYMEFPTVNWSWLKPETTKHVLNQCSFLAHPSLQEGFAYFAAEGLCKGMLLLAGEDWWDGYGYEELIWRQSADGSTHRDNQDKVDFLLSDDPKVKQIYDDVQARFRSRQDNEWDWVLDNLWCKKPEELPIA